MSIFTLQRCWNFKWKETGFQMIGDQSGVELEESRKNGQEDTHLFIFLDREGGQWVSSSVEHDGEMPSSWAYHFEEKDWAEFLEWFNQQDFSFLPTA